MTQLVRACIFAGIGLISAGSVLFAADTPPAGSRTISGVVVNARTGQPIENATVQVEWTSNRRQAGETMTDAEGRFTFDKLADGKYGLSVQRRGYVGGYYDQHEGSGSTAIVTGEGLDTTGIRFAAEPLGTIYGTVTEDSGDPVPQARISLFRRDPRGTGRMIRAHGGIADPMGNFELSQLSPGTYYLCAVGTPWYARRGYVNRFTDQTASTRRPLDLAYALSCYPGVSDTSAAEPVVVGPGERVEADLAMHPVPSIRISVQVPDPGPEKGVNIPQLQASLFGNTEFVETNSMVIGGSQQGEPGKPMVVELSGVAPGQYRIEFPGATSSALGFASIDATADGASVDSSAAVPGVSLTGQVTMAPGITAPANLYVNLRQRQGDRSAGAPVQADGSFQFLQPLAPGEYEALFVGNGRLLSPSRLKASGATVRGDWLTVTGEPVKLTATLIEAKAIVHGVVVSAGKAKSGVFVMLVPEDPDAQSFAWQPNQSDSDGTFDFERVIPGNYTVVAIREGWTLDWARPEVMEKYVARGEKVTVPADAKKIDLKEPVEAQAK